MNQSASTSPKPTGDRSQGTSSALLEAVRRLVAERGNVDFSLSDVAEASGKNPALVGYHFGGKEQLLLAALLDSHDDLVSPLAELQARNIPADEKLRMHLAGFVEVNARNPHLNTLTRVLLRRSSEETAKEITARFIDPMIAFQAAVLEQGRLEGLFRKVDPFTFFLTTIGAIDMLFAANATVQYGFHRKAPGPKERSEFAAELYAMLVAGIYA